MGVIAVLDVSALPLEVKIANFGFPKGVKHLSIHRMLVERGVVRLHLVLVLEFLRKGLEGFFTVGVIALFSFGTNSLLLEVHAQLRLVINRGFLRLILHVVLQIGRKFVLKLH